MYLFKLWKLKKTENPVFRKIYENLLKEIMILKWIKKTKEPKINYSEQNKKSVESDSARQ